MTYSGLMTEDLIRTVEKISGKEIPRHKGDNYLALAEAKRICLGRPMDVWNEIRLDRIDYLQQEVLKEEQ